MRYHFVRDRAVSWNIMSSQGSCTQCGLFHTAPVVHAAWVRDSRVDVLLGFGCIFVKSLRGDVGYCGGRERWSASYDEATGGVTSATAVGNMVENVGCCEPCPTDVSGDLPEEPDLTGTWSAHSSRVMTRLRLGS